MLKTEQTRPNYLRKRRNQNAFQTDSTRSGAKQEEPSLKNLRKTNGQGFGKRIHYCKYCHDEGVSDIDSEGYECFGLLHEIKLEERRSFGADSSPESADENESTPQITKAIYKSGSKRIHVPKNVEILSIFSKSSYTSGYKRAVELRRIGVEQKWMPDDGEVYPTCPGAYRRVKMVQQFRESLGPFGSAVCKFFVISEKRVLNRPLLRGKVHLVLTYCAPLWSYYFIFKDTKHIVGSTISALSIFCCGLWSAILHHKSPKCIWTYKRLRDLDHCGIFVMCCLSPMVLVAHRGREMEYLLYAIVQLSLCIICCIAVLNFGFMKTEIITRVIVYVTVGFSQIGLMGVVLRNATLYEWLTFLSFIWWIIGGLCFGLRWPVLDPDVFSYHEVFHTFSMFGQFALLLLIRSVIDRS